MTPTTSGLYRVSDAMHQSFADGSRLCLSSHHFFSVIGTPVSTSLGDLSNQLAFLGIVHPRPYVTVFRNSIGDGFGQQARTTRKRGRLQSRGTGAKALGKFCYFMRSIMMRHSQDMKYSGTNTTLMSLPPKVWAFEGIHHFCGMCDHLVQQN